MDKIIKMSHKYNFYEKEIKATFMLMSVGYYRLNCPEVIILYDKEKKRDMGFYIMMKDFNGDVGMIINFFYIIPEYQRTGQLTKLINNLKQRKDIDSIHINTSQNPMIYACNKLGFKLQGKSRGDDLRELHFSFVK